LIITVVPDVAGLDGKQFDYLVPEKFRDQVRVGGIVRVALQGRRVRAWVTAVDVDAPAGVTLKPIAMVSRGGLSGDVLDLARWASWRWAGRFVHVLDTASSASARVSTGTTAAAPGVTVMRVAPATAPPVFRNALVVDARRSSVWASAPRVEAIVVLDEHDEGLKEERVPAWHARDVAIERARRAGVPCVLVSPCPSLEALAAADRVVEPSRAEERAGWPILDIVDRRNDDPRSGLYSPRLVDTIRRHDGQAALCILNRKGRSRLLACQACGEVARCERCDAAVVQPADVLVCERCGTERAVFCIACGSTQLRNLRVGAGRVQEELDAILGAGKVVVGTEALLHQPPANVGVVAFVDMDQELLAPRYRASEQAMGLLARAARVLGPRERGGRLVVQTRNPQHPVLDAVLHADPGRMVRGELERRRELGFPPATAMAAVSGAASGEFIDRFGSPLGVEVLGPVEDRWLLRAPDHRTLCDALAETPRPAGRVRIEVDPLRV
jgi:primosomal protein N' (replication factor Y) (superfamily II helicase)